MRRRPTIQQKTAWRKKFARLTEAAREATDAVLTAVHEARQDGLTQADIAHMIGDKSPSGIATKEAKGKALKAARKGRNR